MQAVFRSEERCKEKAVVPRPLRTTISDAYSSGNLHTGNDDAFRSPANIPRKGCIAGENRSELCCAENNAHIYLNKKIIPPSKRPEPRPPRAKRHKKGVRSGLFARPFLLRYFRLAVLDALSIFAWRPCPCPPSSSPSSVALRSNESRRLPALPPPASSTLNTRTSPKLTPNQHGIGVWYHPTRSCQDGLAF